MAGGGGRSDAALGVGAARSTTPTPFRTYVLVIRNAADVEVRVGSLGVLLFKRGYYAYVGSAKRNPEARIRRHLRKEKKLHWHIDYLLGASGVRVETVLLLDAPECTVARILSEHFPCVERFGASDCRCPSHLFFAERPSFEDVLKGSNPNMIRWCGGGLGGGLRVDRPVRRRASSRNAHAPDHSMR
ncbi:MAG: GIY-YIG nuclease family protein [Candidatus Alkanophagales archaeon]